MSDEHSFEVEIDVDAPPEEVWRALVTPDGLRGWFAADARIDERVGGEWWFAHGEAGESSEIEIFDRPRHLRGATTRADGRRAATDFILEPRASKTHVRIVQLDPAPPTAKASRCLS